MPETYERYPYWIVAVSNLISLLTYLAGALIVYQVGLVYLLLHLAYVLLLEFRLLAGHCVNCYYFGKRCAFGRGRLSCFLFKKGSPEKFTAKQLCWRDLVPDFLVALVPAGIAVFILLREFSWSLFALLLLILLLSTLGNAVVRAGLACKYCKQRELGCPAEKLFSKKRK